MNKRFWRDLIASPDHGLWRGAIPATAEENFFFDIVMRLAKAEEDEEKLSELLAGEAGRGWVYAGSVGAAESAVPVPSAPGVRAANKHKGQRKGGAVRGKQRTTVRRLRRIVIEGFLFGPQKAGDMPDYWRLHPQGVDAVGWLVEFFEKLSREKLVYPLCGASAATVSRDITAILAERRSVQQGTLVRP